MQRQRGHHGLGPGRFCSPRHMMPFIQKTRVQLALVDMAGNVCQTVPWS